VRGPVIIGADCTLTDAFVGPYTAIRDNVSVEHAEIENSIVLDHSRICHLSVRVADSLIGKDVTIMGSDVEPLAYRFMVGDSSQIGIL
jgi:glucose-1-phosphate thymidylyltransferase